MAKKTKSFKDPVLQFISGEGDGQEGAKEEAQAAPKPEGEDAKAEMTLTAETAKPARSRRSSASSLQAVPKGYRIDHRYVEVKTRRVQLVFQPSLYDRVKALADGKNLSFNECVHQLLELALKHVKE